MIAKSKYAFRDFMNKMGILNTVIGTHLKGCLTRWIEILLDMLRPKPKYVSRVVFLYFLLGSSDLLMNLKYFSRKCEHIWLYSIMLVVQYSETDCQYACSNNLSAFSEAELRS